MDSRCVHLSGGIERAKVRSGVESWMEQQGFEQRCVGKVNGAQEHDIAIGGGVKSGAREYESIDFRRIHESIEAHGINNRPSEFLAQSFGCAQPVGRK